MPKQPKRPSSQPLNLTAEMRGGLAVLLVTHDAAELAQQPSWHFAVERESCHAAAVTDTTLRLLMYAGLVAHATEASLQRQQARSHARPGRVRFGPNSCFLLTSEGVVAARAADRSRDQMGDSGGPAEVATNGDTAVPVWDGLKRELRWQGRLVKRFRRHAPNQVAVVAAFDEDEWAWRIDSPLVPQLGQDPLVQRHDTLVKLNRQHERLLRFFADGTGEGICWEPRA